MSNYMSEVFGPKTGLLQRNIMESPSQEMSRPEEDTADAKGPVDLCSICYIDYTDDTDGDKNKNKKPGYYTHVMQCGARFCNNCLGAHVRTQVNNGTVQVECANCDGQLEENVIEAYLQDHPLLQQQYERLRADTNSDPKIKSCPNCCRLQQVADEETKLVECDRCGQEWCFACHAPWHEGVSCKAFKRGSKLFTAWANATTHGSANARACPRCGMYIQRSAGCNHMTCPRCKAPFCYLCGHKILSSKLLGDHWSRYSVLGCRYIYKRNRPVQRRVVRGVMLLALLTSLPVLAAVFISFSPIYGAYHITKCVCRRKNQTREVV